MISRDQMDNLLVSWNKLNEKLTQLSLEDIKEMYEIETQGKNRKHIVIRLHQRYYRLKYSIERKKIDKNKTIELQ